MKVLRGKVRVFRRHHDGLVAQESLHRLELDAGHHEARRKCVAQVVPAKFDYAGGANCFLKPPALIDLVLALGVGTYEDRARRASRAQELERLARA